MITGRKQCRSGERCQPKSKRESLYCQGHHSQMERIEIADAMGINPATLSKWIDPNGDERMPEEREIHFLQLTDDNQAYASYMAGLQGFIVYDPKSAPRNVTRMVNEFGDLLKAIDARADGTTTADEADRIEREGTELIAAVRIEIEDAKKAAALGPREVVRA
jgi:hypothetical protein